MAAQQREEAAIESIEIRLLVETGPTYILADVLAMDNANVGAATRLYCGFSLK
jgi:hypothetical protein